MAKLTSRVEVSCAAASTSTAGSYARSAFFVMPSSSHEFLPDDNRDLLRSLHCVALDLSSVVVAEKEKPAAAPPLFLRAAFASVSRKSSLLAAAFDDDLLLPLLLPRSASLCLHEVLLVLSRFHALVVDCSAGRSSRTFLLLQSDEIHTQLRRLHHELAMLLDLLPAYFLGLGDDDIMDLLALASRQCRRSSSSSSSSEVVEQAGLIKASVLSLIDEIEREGIVPARDRLEHLLEMLGINDLASCTNEIDTLEREIIGDRASEPAAAASTNIIALLGLLRFAKCVVFTTPDSDSDSSSSRAHADRQDEEEEEEEEEEEAAPPDDLRCPISLDLMRDPVVAASGHTYDRDSIHRWFRSGNSTCPRTGQVLPNLELVPNNSLKNIISMWCRDNKNNNNRRLLVSAMGGVSRPNKAALEVARMTASFLVNKLSAAVSSFSPDDTASLVVHDILRLLLSNSHARAMVGDAGAVPMLVPLLYSEDARLQLDAMAVLLDLSTLEANKHRIMQADGAVEAVLDTMSSGATWRSKENAAATVLSLASVQTYCRWLGGNRSVVEKLARTAGPAGRSTTRRNALAALLSLAAETENVRVLLDVGVAEAALSAMRNHHHEETAAAALAVLAALAEQRGGAESIIRIDGAAARLVEEMRRGTEWARESATATLVLLCRHLGAQAVTQVMAVPGVERAIWELMDTGSTDRARRKAASLGTICWGYCIGPAHLILIE